MSQSDLLIFSSKLVVFPSHPWHCHHCLLITQIRTLVSPWMLASLSFSTLNQSPRMLFFLRCIFQMYLFLLFLHLLQPFFTLSQKTASCLIILLPTAPAYSPRSPRPPCKQLPAQLSEVLLLACSLIRTLQRPLLAYTAKSQPACRSFKSLHYSLPLRAFHFISHSFPERSHFYD